MQLLTDKYEKREGKKVLICPKDSKIELIEERGEVLLVKYGEEKFSIHKTKVKICEN